VPRGRRESGGGPGPTRKPWEAGPRTGGNGGRKGPALPGFTFRGLCSPRKGNGFHAHSAGNRHLAKVNLAGKILTRWDPAGWQFHSQSAKGRLSKRFSARAEAPFLRKNIPQPDRPCKNARSPASTGQRKR